MHLCKEKKNGTSNRTYIAGVRTYIYQNNLSFTFLNKFVKNLLKVNPLDMFKKYLSYFLIIHLNNLNRSKKYKLFTI